MTFAGLATNLHMAYVGLGAYVDNELHEQLMIIGANDHCSVASTLVNNVVMVLSQTLVRSL